MSINKFNYRKFFTLPHIQLRHDWKVADQPGSLPDANYRFFLRWENLFCAQSNI